MNQYVIDSMKRNSEGRIVVPLLWNSKVSHRLGRNLNLARLVLQSNMKRLKSNFDKLSLYDEALKAHVSDGIIEPIMNVQEYVKDHPNVSFLPHMGVFRMDHKSTKCRVVLLSNLVENNERYISHNQAMESGSNLNPKISIMLTKWRFDKHLLAFDIVKAFLNLAIRDVDQDKLLILWYRNIRAKDYSLIAYKYKRLPFGLRPSPNLLMLSLYKILILDTENDEEWMVNLKKLIYDLSYMDNCAVTCNSSDELRAVFVTSIFNPYKLQLQQFITNHSPLQDHIDSSTGDITPNCVELLGLNFDRMRDKFYTKPTILDPLANSKRKVISSIASNYDVLQINGPLLNRARLFAHKLQCDPKISWDYEINSLDQKEWKNICRQLNNSPSLEIVRCIGNRDSVYELICFTDASKVMFGCVLYLRDKATGLVSFIKSTNRLVSKQLEFKSIPCLELHSIAHGVEKLHETFKDLSGANAVVPINIESLHLFSDSMVALTWINARTVKLAKTQKFPPFVMNRVENIARLCEDKEINFKFIAGHENPADYVTRPISIQLLEKSCYLSGPSFIKTSEGFNDCQISFKMPNPLNEAELSSNEISIQPDIGTVKNFFPVQNYSSLRRLIRVVQKVKTFVNKLKLRIAERFKSSNSLPQDESYPQCLLDLIRWEQEREFMDVQLYISTSINLKCEMLQHWLLS